MKISENFEYPLLPEWTTAEIITASEQLDRDFEQASGLSIYQAVMLAKATTGKRVKFNEKG